MTTFTHPNLLVAIQKSCPELMELTFGCEVMLLSSKEKAKITGIIKTPQWEKVFYIKTVSEPPNEEGNVILDAERFEILGHEPQLHHVLRAIEKTEIKGGEVDLTVYGDIFHIGHYEKFGRNGYYDKCYWDLNHDLYSQPTNVLDFLEQLLVSK